MLDLPTALAVYTPDPFRTFYNKHFASEVVKNRACIYTSKAARYYLKYDPCKAKRDGLNYDYERAAFLCYLNDSTEVLLQPLAHACTKRHECEDKSGLPFVTITIDCDGEMFGEKFADVSSPDGYADEQLAAMGRYCLRCAADENISTYDMFRRARPNDEDPEGIDIGDPPRIPRIVRKFAFALVYARMAKELSILNDERDDYSCAAIAKSEQKKEMGMVKNFKATPFNLSHLIWNWLQPLIHQSLDAVCRWNPGHFE